MAKDTKERILAAALDMFSQYGFAGTNIRELSGSLGMGKSSMYRHFESMEQQAMSKYDPLWEYVKNNASSEMTFDKVRQICGFSIDHSFLNCKKELEAYGYQVGKISMKNQTVKFQPWKQS